MEGSHYVNWNSIAARIVAVYRTEIQRPCLTVKGFNINLVQFLPPYLVVIGNVHVYSFRCTISRVQRRAPKTVLRARNLVYEKLQFIKAWQYLWQGGTYYEGLLLIKWHDSLITWSCLITWQTKASLLLQYLLPWNLARW